MKKVIVVLLMLILFTPVVDAKNPSTIKEYREELQKLKNEKAAYEKEKNKTQSEINQNQNNVKSANDELVNTQNKITILSNDIEKNKEDIKKLEKDIESLLILYQKMSSDNVYIDYVTGAASMTELVMRLDAINKVTEFNNNKINEAEQLIVSNEKMQKELDKYQGVLNEKIVNYENNIKNLKGELKDLIDEYESYDQQIKGVEETIKLYKDMGCGEEQDLSTCAQSLVNNSGWLRPFKKGKITSAWGYRIHPTKGTWKFHNGIDISDSGILGREIYATAAGKVVKITRKSSCGGNMVYLNVYVNGKAYTTTYMHLLDVNVKVGDYVTAQSVIGTVGGSRSATPWDTCTTGAHLHYGVSTGHYLGVGKDAYSSYSKYVSNSINPPAFPGVGAWFYSR